MKKSTSKKSSQELARKFILNRPLATATQVIKRQATYTIFSRTSSAAQAQSTSNEAANLPTVQMRRSSNRRRRFAMFP